MKDYYAILGVSSSATEAEIKRAFRRLAVRYHPDKDPSPEATARFHEINEAYDTLGDGRKRAVYDSRRLSAYSVVVATPPPKQHRDPAYRPRTTPTKPSGPPKSYLLMRDYLKYLNWVSKIALGFTIIFFIDYFLPTSQISDQIQQVYVKGGRADRSFVIITDGGEEFSVDQIDRGMVQGTEVRLDVTPVYKTPLTLSNLEGTYRESVAYMYGSHLFFPVLLFIISLLALLNKKRVEFCFNLNLTASILLIINLSLL